MNFNINKLLVIFVIFSSVCSQTPTWLLSELEENEELVEDINELITSKLSPATSFNILSETLYFIPDSLILFYLKSDSKLSLIDDYYIDQFFITDKKFSSRSIYRRALNKTDFNGLGDQSRLKSNYSFSERYYKVQLSQQKSAYETYYKHTYFFGSYRFKSFHIYAGHLKFSGFNSLVFSSQYGSFYYGFNSIIKNKETRVSAQSGINRQNVMNGFASSYRSRKFKIYAIYGTQNYSVRIENSLFHSFNFYHPIEMDNDNNYDSVTEKIGLCHLNYEFNNDLSISGSWSSIQLSDTYMKNTDFSPIELNQSNFFGIYINYSKNNFIGRLNVVKQKNSGNAYELSSSYKTRLTKFESIVYRYDESFINPHSAGVLNGSSFATNLSGHVFNGIFKLSKTTKLYFGVHSRRKLQASKFEDDDTKAKKSIYFGFLQKWNDSSFLLRYVNKSQRSIQATLTSDLYRTKLYYYPGKNGISFSTEKRFGKLFSKLTFVSTDESLRVYKNGFQWEFLSESFKGENVNLNLKYSFDYSENASLSIDYHGTYRLDKDEFGSGTKQISTHLKNEIGVYLSLIY